jgi:hypothetical protein
MHKPVLLFVCLLIQVIGRSQDYAYSQYTTKNGLPSNTIYEVTKDKRGFLWFGTEFGLVRFDGINYRVYTVKDGLPGNEIIKVWCDSFNRIWVIPFNKAVAFIRNDSVFDLKNSALLNNVKEISSFSGGVTNLGDTWICQNQDIRIISGNSYRDIPLNISGDIREVIEKNGNVLVNSYKQYFTVSGGGKKTSILPDVTYNNGNIFRLDDSVIISFNQTGVLFSVLRGDTHVLTKKLILPKSIQDIYRYNGRTIALLSDGGFQFVNISRNIFELTGEVYLPEFIFTKAYYSDGNLWLASRNQGLFKLRDLGRIVSRKSSHFNSLISGHYASEFYAGDMDGSVYRVNDSLHLEKIMTGKMRALGFFDDKKETYALFDMSIKGLKNKFVLENHNPRLGNMGELGSMKDAIRDSDKIFGASSMGLWSYNISSGEVKRFDFKRRATTLTKLKGSLYYGSLDGLYKCDINTNVVQKISNFNDRINTLNSFDDMIIVGTAASGLVILHDDKPVYELNEAKGMISNICKRVRVYDHSVWICTNKGISRLEFQNLRDTTTYNLVNYNIYDGLLDNDISDITFKDDKAFVISGNGIMSIQTTANASTEELPIYFSSVKVNNEEMPFDHDLELSYRQNNLTIEFTGICFNCGDKLKYRYRLSETGSYFETSNNSVQLLGLRPGNYIFEVFILNKYNRNASLPIRLKIRISNPYWLRPWFIISASLLTMLIIAYALNRRQKNLITKSRYQQQIVDFEMQALRAQINPHFIFNSLNSIKYLVTAGELKNANHYLDNLSRMMRNTLEFSGKPLISIRDEINYIENYIGLERMRFEDSFSYSIEVNIPAPERVNIPSLLLQPYIENAIRHGLRNDADSIKNLKIIFETFDELHYSCDILDNGIGIEESKRRKSESTAPIEYQSRGMEISIKRAELYNIKVEITDRIHTHESGTLVKLIIPYNLHYDKSNTD